MSETKGSTLNVKFRFGYCGDNATCLKPKQDVRHARNRITYLRHQQILGK